MTRSAAQRDVVHIEDRIGPHGGEYWLLTLACGHLAVQRKPRGSVCTVADPSSGGGVQTFRSPFARPRLAPKRKMCPLCGSA